MRFAALDAAPLPGEEMKFKLLFPLIGVITLTAFVLAIELAVWLTTYFRAELISSPSTYSDEYSREPS
jgi:hypothetical protein